MARFSAKHNAVIDDKGRVVLPSSFKKAMGDQVDLPITIEKDVFSRCLNIYPEVHWIKKVDEFESRLNPFDEEDIELKEQFYENFATIKMAANGRINIPADFLEFANLRKEVVLSGMGNLIRVWDAENFKERVKTRKPLKDMYKEKLGNNPTGDKG